MNDELREQAELLEKAAGMDIFWRRGGRDEPGGYKFTCPGVAVGSHDVRVEIREGLWHLSHDDHTGVADSQVCAYLALISDRWGYTAKFTRKPESAAQQTEGEQP